MKKKQNINLNGTSLWIGSTITIAIILGVLGIWWLIKVADFEMRKDLLLQTIQVEKATNLYQVKALTGTKSDLNSSQYQLLKEQLSLVLLTKKNSKFLYILGRNTDGSVFFFLDADKENPAQPGEIYKEASKELRNLFDTKIPYVEGPLADEWGTWISALVPVVEPATGELLAVLGMDIDARTWKWDVAAHIALPISIMLIVLILLASGFIIYRSHVEESVRLRETRLTRAELASKSGNWELYLDSQIIIASEGAIKLFGVDKNQFEYAVIKKIPLPEYRQLLDDALKNLIENNEPYDVEYKIKTVDTDDIKDIHSVAIFNKEKRILFGVIQDITERKRAEQALRESEEKYRALVDEVNDGLYISDSLGIFTFVNRAMARILGFEHPNKVVGRRFLEFVPPAKVNELSGLYQVAMESGIETEVVSTEVVRQDGAQAFIEIKPQVIIDGDRIVGNRGIVRDITERKRTERRIIESEANARAIMESTSNLILLLDKNGVVIDTNEGNANRLGLTRIDLLGKNIYDYLSEEIVTKQKNSINKVIATGLPLHGEYMIDGRWTEFSIFPIIIENEIADKVAIFGQDITERKKAELALKESHLKYRIVAYNTHDWEFWLSPDNKYIYNSPSCKRITGYDSENFLNDPQIFRNIIHPDDRDIFAKHKHTADTVMEPAMVEFRIISADGSIKWIDHVCQPVFDADGKFLGTRGSNRDSTERKNAEESLKESEARLLELNATKDKFFSIISHDLKNPFNAIIGFSNILAEQIQEKNFDNIVEYAGIIQNSSQRTMDLLMNLLEWSRSQSGKIEFSPKPIEIDTLIDEVVTLLNDSAKQKSITISRNTIQNILVYADKPMIGTILRNLISNAVKFTNPGGEIVISTEQKPDELMVIVSDNGVGMKKGVIEKLFRIDENHSTEGTQHEKGTGLGLILCKEFIEKHGGKIWAESEVSKGSKFYFTIPKV